MIKAAIAKLEEDGYGHESIFVANGTGRNTVWQVPLIAAALKTPNVGATNLSGQSCYAPRIYGTFASLGDYCVTDMAQCSENRYNDPAWSRPDVLVVWGNEPLKSNADGFIGHWLLPAIQMGTKVISIDPVLTWWSARAEYWLPLRPGTDEALALAWLHVITQEDLIDHEFVTCWCAFYDELKEHVRQFTPAWAAEVCGVPEEDIVASARLYAGAEKGAIQWGLAFDTQVSAMELCLSVTDLMAICGNIDRPGTMKIVRNAFDIDAGESTSDIFCGSTFEKKLTAAVLGSEGLEFCGSVDSDAVNVAMECGEPYPIKIMWAQSSNALACMAFDAPRTYEAIKNSIDFCVYADPFMTPSAVAFADLVLPVAMSIERDSARTWWTPLRTMKKVTSYYEAKSDEEIICWPGKPAQPRGVQNAGLRRSIWCNDYMETALAITDGEGNVVKPGFDLSLDLGADERSTYDLRTAFRCIDETKTPFDDVTETSCGWRYDEWNGAYEKYDKGMLRPDHEKGFNTPTGRLELVPPVVSRVGHRGVAAAQGKRAKPAMVRGRRLPQGIPVLLHQRVALLRVLPFRTPPARNDAGIPSPSSGQGQPEDRPGLRPARRRLDMDGEPGRPLHAEGRSSKALATPAFRRNMPGGSPRRKGPSRVCSARSTATRTI